MPCEVEGYDSLLSGVIPKIWDNMGRQLGYGVLSQHPNGGNRCTFTLTNPAIWRPTGWRN